MATQHASDEAHIRQRIGQLTEALRAMDLDGVMAIYAPDIVSFDIVPPLQHVGAEAKKQNWANAFAMYQRPLEYEIRDLTITIGDDMALIVREHHDRTNKWSGKSLTRYGNHQFW
jgi:ketosteroid isomerase-like protein